MMRLCCMSLSYQRCFQQKEMDIFTFLEACRNINLDAASFHVRSLGGTATEHLKRVRRKYFDLGLALGAIGVTTDFGLAKEKLPTELKKAKEGIEVAMFPASCLRSWPGSASAMIFRAGISRSRIRKNHRVDRW